MKRLTALIVLAVAVATVAFAGTGASNGKSASGDYKVRAIFDSAVSVIMGEDVKVAGVKVGRIASLDVTKDKKAAVTLEIADQGFHDFRQDAQCTIRPQSLIGEKFVECTPTQPQPPGSSRPPLLGKIISGPGHGQYLLPLKTRYGGGTSSPVDIDLIGNVLRRPYAQRLSILLAELGTGLAGRGSDINDIIRRANPALQETDKVLKLLADQNRVLANLVTDSDTAIAPLARDRARVSHFIESSATVAQATAEHRANLERTLAKLPGFLRELSPFMRRLGALSDQATPVLADLGSVAPSVNRLVRTLGPFSAAATPAIKTLGDAAVVGTPAARALNPIVKDLDSFASRAKPLARNLSALTNSFKNTGGVERLMDYIFFQTTAINGYDAIGHYLRAGLIVNLCSTYSIAPTSGCSANFSKANPSSATAANAGRTPALVREDAALRGKPASAQQAPSTGQAPDGAAAGSRRGAGGVLNFPSIAFPGALSKRPSPGGTTGATGFSTPASPAGSGPTTDLLDYLLGGGH